MNNELQALIRKVDLALSETLTLVEDSLESLRLELTQTDEVLQNELEEKQNLLKHKQSILNSLKAEHKLLSSKSSPKKLEVHFSPDSSSKEDTQDLILLHHKISQISWNYIDTHISGTIKDKFFRFTSDSAPNSYTVNKLWDLLDKLNN